MNIEIKWQRKDENTMRVSFIGSLDTATYTECEEQLKKALTPVLKAYVFDMTDLEYISSIGFAVLFRAKRASKNREGLL